MSIASQGHPSSRVWSGPLATHLAHPMQVAASTRTVPSGGWASSGAQYMQASTGQQSTHTGDPAQPVQHSVTTAMRAEGFLRRSVRPWDMGSRFVINTNTKKRRTFGIEK